MRSPWPFSDYVPNALWGPWWISACGSWVLRRWTEPDCRLAAEFLRTYPRHHQWWASGKSWATTLSRRSWTPLWKSLWTELSIPFNTQGDRLQLRFYRRGRCGVRHTHRYVPCGHRLPWQRGATPGRITAFACSDIGMKGMLRAAEIMTLAAIRTMDSRRSLPSPGGAEAEERRGSYHCPLPDFVTPPIGRY